MSKGYSDGQLATLILSAQIAQKSEEYGEDFMKAIVEWVNYIENGVMPSWMN